MQAPAHEQGGDAVLQPAPGSFAGAENGNELQEQANADNGWDEHVGWDFQDVPLDSPRAAKKHHSPDDGNTAQDDGISASRRSPDVSASSVSADSRNSQQQVAALQQENKTLKQRLKRVEAVSPLVSACLRIVRTCSLVTAALMSLNMTCQPFQSCCAEESKAHMLSVLSLLVHACRSKHQQHAKCKLIAFSSSKC